MRKLLFTFIIILLTANLAMAITGWIGYSGAPGSRGACAVSCHFRQHYNPSVTINGFPEYFEPNQSYEIEILSTTDNAIRNFNSSIRIGSGSQNGGVIQAGTNTAVYNHAQETNGVHWNGSSINSGTFTWIAPEAGTGEVRLYYAGLQGSLSNGASYETVIISNEMTSSVDDTRQLPQLFDLKQNYPNPFNGETIIKADIGEPGEYELLITNILGQIVISENMTVNEQGIITFRWNSNDQNGVSVPSGIYFYSLAGNETIQTQKMIYLK